MHEMHSMSGMLWSMAVLGVMPFILVLVGTVWYLRSRDAGKE